MDTDSEATNDSNEVGDVGVSAEADEMIRKAWGGAVPSPGAAIMPSTGTPLKDAKSAADLSSLLAKHRTDEWV